MSIAIFENINLFSSIMCSSHTKTMVDSQDKLTQIVACARNINNQCSTQPLYQDILSDQFLKGNDSSLMKHNLLPISAIITFFFSRTNYRRLNEIFPHCFYINVDGSSGEKYLSRRLITGSITSTFFGVNSPHI